VRGDGQQVGLEFLQVDVDPAGAPATASQWKMMLLPRQISAICSTGWITPISLFTIMIEARMVSGRNRRLELLDVDQAVLLHFRVRRLETLPLELAHRVEHRLVLGLLRDDVLALGLGRSWPRP